MTLVDENSVYLIGFVLWLHERLLESDFVEHYLNRSNISPCLPERSFRDPTDCRPYTLQMSQDVCAGCNDGVSRICQRCHRSLFDRLSCPRAHGSSRRRQLRPLEGATHATSLQQSDHNLICAFARHKRQSASTSQTSSSTTTSPPRLFLSSLPTTPPSTADTAVPAAAPTTELNAHRDRPRPTSLSLILSTTNT